jgi:hypothetical protein
MHIYIIRMQASKTVERITKRIKSKDSTEISSSTDSLPPVVAEVAEVVEVLPVVTEVVEAPLVSEASLVPLVSEVPLETNENTKGSQTVDALEEVPMEIVEV